MRGSKAGAGPMQKGPPGDLGAAGKALWVRLAAEYKLADANAEAVLLLAARAQDRAEACRAAIKRDGLTTKDRWGQVKPHVLLAAERDARAQVLQALRQLSLPIPEE